MRFSELEGSRIGVWGAGREIRSFAAQVARRLPSAAIEVVVFDGAAPADAASLLQAPRARIVGAEEAPAALAGCDVLVRSPGVSVYRPEIAALRARGVPVTTATALWLAENGGGGVIGITGTKGKSTTAALTHHLAVASGARARLAGNIGSPALDLLDEPRADVTVLELSSYQLADLQSGPQVALVTNLYREHTDWHGSEDAYRADKLRILRLPGVRSVVVNGRERALVSAAEGLGPVLYGVPCGWDVSGGVILRGGDPVMSAADLPLPGEHNALNLCGALAALEAFGIAPPQLPGAVGDFHALAHRLEPVPGGDGRLWSTTASRPPRSRRSPRWRASRP